MRDPKEKPQSVFLRDRKEAFIPILGFMDAIIRRFFFATREIGLEPIRSAFLSVLSIVDEPMSQLEVAELIFRTPSSISSMSRKLEKEKLIQRQKAPYDRKAQLLTLTEKGKQYSIHCDTESEKILTEMFKSLSDKEIKILGDLLGKILDDLTEQDDKWGGWYHKAKKNLKGLRLRLNPT